MELTTQQTAEGFFFADDEEKAEGVMTCITPKGIAIKQVTLPDSRKVFQMRKATDRDFLLSVQQTKSKHKGDKLKGARLITLIAICSTCEGKQVTVGEVMNLSIPDFTKLAFILDRVNAQ